MLRNETTTSSDVHYAEREAIWSGPSLSEVEVGRVISMKDMLRVLHGADIVSVTEMVATLKTWIEHDDPRRGQAMAQSRCRDLLNAVTAFCMPASIKKVRALLYGIERTWGGEVHSSGTIELMRSEAATVIEAELDTIVFLHLDSNKAPFFSDPKPFGDEVATAFPSATSDVAEAARCFALGRNTACVFHLARALEVALQVLFAAIHPGRKPDQNWNTLINQIQSALDAGQVRPDPVPSDWKEIEKFYCSATAHFRYIKTGWRNPADHPGPGFTEEDADAIFRATRAFMRELSKRLHE